MSARAGPRREASLTADPLFLALIAVVSLLLSYIGATVGLVLGQLRVALLVYALGSATLGTATSLAISTAGTMVGTLRHAMDGRVELKLLLSVGLPSAAAAFFSARYAQHVDQRVLKLAIAVTLIFTGLSMLVTRRPRAEGSLPEPPPRIPPMLAEVVVGTVLGAISGLVGLLLGSLRLPAMIRYARIATPTAIGTNMAIGTLTGLSAGVATFLEGQIDPFAFAVVAPTTVIGAHFGARKTGQLAPETLTRVIAWVLAATGLLMLAEDLIKRWLAP